MGSVEQSRRAIRGYSTEVALRAAGAEIYQHLPRSLQKAIHDWAPGSAGCCLALVEGCPWALRLYG